MQRSHRRKTHWMQAFILLAGCLMLIASDSAHAKGSKRPPAGPLIAIYAPYPEQLELALNEIELEWNTNFTAQSRVPVPSTIEVPDARLVASDRHGAVYAIYGIKDIGDLVTLAKALEAANPGAQAHFVLYEPGLPQSAARRRLLTREVGLLLEHDESLGSVLAGMPVRPARAVPGLSDGYVIEAEDPIGALHLVDGLRDRAGVQSVYPLFKRSRFPR